MSKYSHNNSSIKNINILNKKRSTKIKSKSPTISYTNESKSQHILLVTQENNIMHLEMELIIN